MVYRRLRRLQWRVRLKSSLSRAEIQTPARTTRISAAWPFKSGRLSFRPSIIADIKHTLDPQQPPAEPGPTPRIGIRLFWWFGIYFGGQLPLIKDAEVFPLFPLGLLNWIPRSPDNPIHPPNFAPFIVAAYGFYLTHFILSVWFSRATAFRILMLGLLVVVVLNTIACRASIEAETHFAP
jgi:hypothetical protein